MRLSAIQQAHLEWIKRNAPGVLPAFQAYMRRKALGEVEAKPESLLDKIMAFAQGYTQYRSQREILKVQQDRMRQGLPPLETEQYGMPPIRVEAGATPSAQKTTNLLIIGALGLGLLWIIGGRARRRA